MVILEQADENKNVKCRVWEEITNKVNDDYLEPEGKKLRVT